MLLGFAGLLLLAGLVPVGGWEALPDLCFCHRMTGLPCPTCGLTRSWAALAHGQLAASFRFHALGGVSLVLFGLFLGARRLWPRARPLPPVVLALAVATWSGYTIGRMVGLFPGP